MPDILEGAVVTCRKFGNSLQLSPEVFDTIFQAIYSGFEIKQLKVGSKLNQ